MQRRSILWSALLLLSCAASGAALAVSLRGGTWAILSPILLVPQFFAIIGKSRWIETEPCIALFGLSFFAVAFQGLLGPMNGAFSGIWILLTVVYAVLHLSVCLVFRLSALRIGIGSLWLLPAALVAYEYARHLLTKLYDDCGLTFCLVGQTWADNDLLIQSADVGGVWLLSFAVAVGAATITAWITQPRSRTSIAMLASFVACLALMTLYGSVRIAQLPDDSPVIGHVILVPNRLSVDMLKVQADPLLKEVQVQSVPFVESHPFGTEWLQQAGLIPVVTDRKVAPPIRPNIEDWSDQSIPWAVGVCYDIFFPETFKKFSLSETGAIVCSLDENFDQNGVFRPLSAIHSRLRAVEFRRPVVRCSVGGPSGVYDSTGRLIDPQARRGIVTLHEIRSTKRRTLYARFGDWIPLACGLIAIATIRPVRFRQRFCVG